MNTYDVNNILFN